LELPPSRSAANQLLLGQSFLRQFDTVEIKGDRMILR